VLARQLSPGVHAGLQPGGALRTLQPLARLLQPAIGLSKVCFPGPHQGTILDAAVQQGTQVGAAGSQRIGFGLSLQHSPQRLLQRVGGRVTDFFQDLTTSGGEHILFIVKHPARQGHAPA
jgi:hypothetical protein